MFIFRLDIPTVSPVKVVKFHEVDKSFGLDLLQELARAYTASSNTRTQVIQLESAVFVVGLYHIPSSDIADLAGAIKFW